MNDLAAIAEMVDLTDSDFILNDDDNRLRAEPLDNPAVTGALNGVHDQDEKASAANQPQHRPASKKKPWAPLINFFDNSTPAILIVGCIVSALFTVRALQTDDVEKHIDNRINQVISGVAESQESLTNIQDIKIANFGEDLRQMKLSIGAALEQIGEAKRNQETVVEKTDRIAEEWTHYKKTIDDQIEGFNATINKMKGVLTTNRAPATTPIAIGQVIKRVIVPYELLSIDEIGGHYRVTLLSTQGNYLRLSRGDQFDGFVISEIYASKASIEVGVISSGKKQILVKSS